MLGSFSRNGPTLALGAFGALLVAGIGIAAVYEPIVAVCAAAVPIIVWLAGRARRPVLPWLAIAGIVAAGVNLPGNIPLGDFSCVVALVLCVGDRVELPTKVPQQLRNLLILVFLAAALSVVLDQPPLGGAGKRVVHIAIYACLIGALAAGRIRSQDLVRGIRVGIVIGLVTGIAGLAGVSRLDFYPGRLTGSFADPNVASLVTVALGMIALHYSRTRREFWWTMALMAVVVGLTLSRTGALALVLALVWYLWVHRMPRTVGIALVVAAIVIAIKLPTTLSEFGPLNVHVQSNAIRGLINQASNQAVIHHFLTGTGAGTAQVVISNGEVFFFHNSYLSMIAEFGLPMALVIAVLFVLSGMTLWRSTPRAPAIEAALLAVLIMALTLGEVIFTLSAAIVLGTAWRHSLLMERAHHLGMPEIPATSPPFERSAVRVDHPAS